MISSIIKAFFAIIVYWVVVSILVYLGIPRNIALIGVGVIALLCYIKS